VRLGGTIQRNVELEIKLHMEALDTKRKKRKEAAEPSSRFSPCAVMVDIATRYLMSLIDDGSSEPPRSWSVEVTKNYLLPRAVAAWGLFDELSHVLGEKTYEVIRGKLDPGLEDADYERCFSGIDLGVIEYFRCGVEPLKMPDVTRKWYVSLNWPLKWMEIENTKKKS
jgi:hypothetical protein